VTQTCDVLNLLLTCESEKLAQRRWTLRRLAKKRLGNSTALGGVALGTDELLTSQRLSFRRKPGTQGISVRADLLRPEHRSVEAGTRLGVLAARFASLRKLYESYPIRCLVAW